jgi:NADH-ubiquinone oxidoreductase chain 5
MYLTLLFLPAIAAAATGLLGRKIGVTGAHLITTTSMGITALLTFVAFYEVALCGSPLSMQLVS